MDRRPDVDGELRSLMQRAEHTPTDACLELFQTQTGFKLRWAQAVLIHVYSAHTFLQHVDEFHPRPQRQIMSNFPPDIYARNLLSHRGYALWTPEPNIELPESYQREGLKIGDVGVVVPEDGSFDVFFNITLPREHALHAPDGVPDNFTQVELRREDYRVIPEAECPGRVISSSSVDCTVTCIDPFDLNGKARSLTDCQFNLCQNEGAMLILPEGAERHRLAKELLLLDVVIQNAIDWYRFAREQLYRDIRSDALFLVTGFHKACSWSLASFKNTGASSARCKLVQLTNGGPILTAHSTWETVRPLEWRLGPRHSIGIPNQSVFITGFKIAVNEELLHLKRVTVKADHSKRILASTLVGFGAGLANLFVTGTSGEIQSPEVATQHGADNKSTIEDNSSADEHEGVTVERVPKMSQPFHPSDIINRYLLAKEPSARIAVTHDSQWISLLEKGILRQEDLMQEGYLEAVMSREYHIVTKDGAVYLQNTGLETSSSNYEDSTSELPQCRCGWMTRQAVCGLLVKSSEFSEHLRSYHGVIGPDKAKLMCCWIGCFTEMTKEHLTRHVNERHLEPTLAFPHCPEQSTHPHTLQQHSVERNNPQGCVATGPRQPPNSKYPCPHCPKQFTSSYTLQRHISGRHSVEGSESQGRVVTGLRRHMKGKSKEYRGSEPGDAEVAQGTAQSLDSSLSLSSSSGKTVGA